MSLPTVLVVDDHPVVAEGLVRLLADRFVIVGTIRDGLLAFDAARRLDPDVILLDISLPNMSGLEAIRRLWAADIKGKILVLTMHADPDLAVEALSAGASGYVLKESSGDELLTALEVVLRGGKYLPSGLTKEIVTLMVGAAPHGAIELTTLQREVLRLIVRGQRAKEIAATLNMSTRSVEAVKYKTMRLLDVHSTAELVRYAIEQRLVPF